MIKRLIIVILIVAAGVGAYLAYNMYFRTGHYEKLVGEKLRKVVHDGSQGLYKLEYERISIDPFSVSISIDGVRIFTDSIKLRQRKLKNGVVVDVSIDNIKLHHASAKAFVMDKKIKINSISINNCRAIINRGDTTEAIEDSIQHTLYDLIKKDIESISLDSIVINNTRLILPGRGKMNKIAIENFDLRLYEVLLDSQSVKDESRFLLARTAIASLKQFSLPKAGFYSMEANDLIVRIPEGTGSSGSVKLTPLVTDAQFAKQAGMDKKLVKMNIGNIKFTGFDHRKLLIDQELILKEVKVNGLNIDVYHPKYLKKDTTNLVGDYPHQLVQNLDLPIDIKTLSVSGAKVIYRQQNPKSGKLGKLIISGISGKFTNVSNLKSSPRYMNFYGKGLVQGAVALETKWVFDMHKKGGFFSIKGSAGSFDGKSLNSVLEPLGMVKIESGDVSSVKFDLHGSDYRCEGSVSFMYDNMKVQVLENEDGAIKNKKFKTALANALLINNSNKPGDRIPDTLNAKYDRDKNRNIFHLVWYTVLDGMKKNLQHGKAAAKLLKGQKKTKQP